MNFKYKAVIAAVAIGPGTASQLLFAQDDAIEEVVISSSRIPVPLRQIGMSVSIINQEVIEAHGNLALPDILRQMPAIGTSNSGGTGQPTSLRIRGEEGFRTLAILDGIRLSDSSGTQITSQPEHLMSNGIGRIEVLRGPQGFSYGADAGGVLNISSRREDDGLTANMDVQAGRFDTRQYSANAGGGNEKVDFFASVADFETGGFNARDTDTLLQDNDGYENTTFHGRVGVSITDRLRADVVYRNVDGISLYDGCGGFDCVSLYHMQAGRVGLEYNDEYFSHAISYSKTGTDRDFLISGASTFVALGELTRFEYVGSASSLPGFDLVYGLDFEEASNNGKGRDNVGFFAEYLSDFSDAFYLTAGVRYDDNDDFGSNASYRISGAYLHELSNGNTLKFKSSYGTGFRAPAPAEIAYNTGPFAFPPASNVILQQETSRGYEFGIEYLTDGSLHLEAVWFNQEVEDAIEFDLVDFSGYTQLTGTSNSKGIEMNSQYTVGSFDLRANYTFNETEMPNGLARRRRPEQLANLGVTWHGIQERLTINAFYRISRDSFDGTNAPLTRMDDFEVLDLGASYHMNNLTQIYVRFENALDEKYEEVVSYNTPGVAAYFGIRASFVSP